MTGTPAVAMGWFTKKPDPLTDRARELSKEIATLEAEIKQLSSRSESRRPQHRSTVQPGNLTPAPAAAADPVFETIDLRRVKSPETEPEGTPAHYNDLGVRKYDLVSLWRRIRHHLHGPPASNPKLINYLAAGSIQGLRPLRYEKRVARNRFVVAFLFLLLVLWGLSALFFRYR